MLKHLPIFFFLSAFYTTAGQQGQNEERLKIFIQCNFSDLCDQDFIRTEIGLTDFVRDPFDADVHIIVVGEVTGSGGEKNTITYIGQRRFAAKNDTLVFFTNSNATQVEKRIQMIRLLKIGLIPYLEGTSAVENILIEFPKQPEEKPNNHTTDKWKKWVFTVGGRMRLNGDKNYKENSLGGNFSAAKVTESFKTSLNVNCNQYRNLYRYEENGEEIELKTLNKYISISHDYIKSMSPKWSLGYETNFQQSTYDNYDYVLNISPGIEYNFFSYSLSSSRFLVLRYRVTAEKRKYLQETLYNKWKELLFSNDLGLYASFTQKWGTVDGSLSWYNYLHNFSKNNLSLNLYFEIRVFKGLSVFCYTRASIIRDQLNVAKQGANQQEVLLRLKALTTSYNYYTGFGINYRFGSATNNVVNTRFTNGKMF